MTSSRSTSATPPPVAPFQAVGARSASAGDNGPSRARPGRLAAATERAPDALLSVMAHELRTPITTIYAGSTVLARERSLPPKAAQHLAADISAEAARLYDVVEDLITLARLERTGLEPLREPVVLGRLIDGVIRVMADRAIDVEFRRTGTNLLPPVDVDAAFVDQAARNVAVALVRCSSARAVDIRLEHDPEADEVRVAFRPRAMGGGSPLQAVVPTVTPSLRASPPGTAAPSFDFETDSSVGIGLFVARELIEATDGRIWLTDEGDGRFELGFAFPTTDPSEASAEMHESRHA